MNWNVQYMAGKNYVFFYDRLDGSGPDRTIDYLFLSVDIKIKNKYVRQQDTLAISDHLPVVAEIVVQ
jgi:endonuclease/exonuclease/phosphatase family metal-dependent hydrolase